MTKSPGSDMEGDRNLLHRAAYTTIGELEPFFDLLAVSVDGHGLLDIGSCIVSVSPSVTPRIGRPLTVSKL